MLSIVKNRITLHIVGRLIRWCGLVFCGVVIAFLFSQFLRVAPVFAGAPLSVGDGLYLLAQVAVPVAGFALTPALLVGIFAVGSQMQIDGELVALEAAGISRRRILGAFATFVVIVAVLSAWLWWVAGPSAVAGVREKLFVLSDQAVVGGLEPGQFTRLADGVTFYADSQNGRSFGGVFVDVARADGASMMLTAASGRLHPPSKDGDVRIEAQSGALLMRGEESRFHAQFDQLSLSVPVEDKGSEQFNFFPAVLSASTVSLMGDAPTPQRNYELWRRMAGPLGVLSLGALSLAVLFGGFLPRPAWAAVISLVAFVVYHLAVRSLEAAALSGGLAPAVAALVPAGAVVLLTLSHFGIIWIRTRQSIVRNVRFM